MTDTTHFFVMTPLSDGRLSVSDGLTSCREFPELDGVTLVEVYVTCARKGWLIREDKWSS